MMSMPYSSVSDRPANQTAPRVSAVRYVLDATSTSAFPYTCRLHVVHKEARNHLRVRIGAKGHSSLCVWDCPNQRLIQDDSQTLRIDVPLPDYAAACWPPGPANV